MPAVQSTYAAAPGIGFVGMVADLSKSDIISRTVETAAVGFGKAVIQGTADEGCKTGAAGVFLGVTVKDVTLPADRSDAYAVGDTAAIIRKGAILVTAPATIAAGEAAYRTSAGVITNASSGNTAITGAKFETSGASGDLVRLYLG